MGFRPNFGVSGLQLVGSVSAFALQNATPTILTYTTPNDGKVHPLLVAASLVVATLEVGGAVTLAIAGGMSVVIFGSAKAVGTYGLPDLLDSPLLVPANTVVTISQTAALTSGAATVTAQIFGA